MARSFNYSQQKKLAITIDITALFVCLNDFCKIYESTVKAKALPYNSSRHREGYSGLSEMLFIEALYYFRPYKDFKHYYFTVFAGSISISLIPPVINVLFL